MATATYKAPDNTLFTVTVLFVCALIPIALSYFFFAQQSLRLDEAQSLWQTSRNFSDIFTIVAGDVHVPFYHLLLRLWRIYIGDSVDLARLLSLAAYVASIPALYMLGRRAYNRRIALFAVFLFSISPFMNWYGNEIRMYTLFTFFVILNQYFFIRLFKDESPSDHVWSGYILTALLGVFTHYFFFLNLLSQAVFYFLRRDLFSRGSLGRFVLAFGIIVVSFLPWVWYVLRLGTAGFQEPVLAKPSSVDLFSSFNQFLFGFQSDNVNKFFLSLWPLVVILRLYALQRSKRLNGETEYLLITLLLSFSLAFFGSFVMPPIFVSRYLIFTIPSFYLLLASLFDIYPVRGQTIARWSLALVMVITLGLEIANPTMPLEENYKAVASYLTTHATAQDAVLLSAPFTIYPMQYYYRGNAPISTLPVWNQYAHGAIPPFVESALPEQVARVAGSNQNIYVVLSYDQGYEKKIKDYFDTHYQMTATAQFSRDLNLYVYRVRYDTAASAIATAQKGSAP